MLIPTCTITVRVIVVRHAKAWHLKTDAPGFCRFVLMIGSEAGRKMEETELLGAGMYVQLVTAGEAVIGIWPSW